MDRGLVRQHDLHSTMFLLIHVTVNGADNPEEYLHSTMFLLILNQI